MKELYNAIAQIGFPIVVSVLLLVRVEKKMSDLADKITELNNTITKLTTIIDERMKRK